MIQSWMSLYKMQIRKSHPVELTGAAPTAEQTSTEEE